MEYYWAEKLRILVYVTIEISTEYCAEVNEVQTYDIYTTVQFTELESKILVAKGWGHYLMATDFLIGRMRCSGDSWWLWLHTKVDIPHSIQC